MAREARVALTALGMACLAVAGVPVAATRAARRWLDEHLPGETSDEQAWREYDGGGGPR
jgi:hypothetical protein